MKISDQQLTTLSDIDQTNYIEKFVEFLQSEFPDAKKLSNDILTPVVLEQITNAHSYKLITEQQISNYITTAWLLGQNFDTEFPAAQEMLISDEYSATDKVKWLSEWSIEMLTTLEENN